MSERSDRPLRIAERLSRFGRISFAFACVALCAAGAGPLRAAVAPGEVPLLVQRASAEYAASVRGFIGMRRHFTTELRGGPFRHREESESAFVMDGGAYVRIKYYSILDDGKMQDRRKLADRESQTNRDWAEGKVFFKEPYDPRFVDDYRFAPPAACAECPTGTEAVEFTSAVADAQHGDGTMWIESATGRVAKLTYVPKVFPPHATAGSVTETGGEAMPNLWYVTRIDETYEGRAWMLKGTATFVGTFDRFRRFAGRSEAEAALDEASL